MKNAKKALIGLIIGIIIASLSITALAASAYSTPAEVISELTGRTTDEVIAEKMESQKTYGAIADEAGKLDEFREEMLELKKNNLADQVESGKITQEKADDILKSIEDKRATCDGTGSGKVGQSMKAKFGSNGSGEGFGGANRGQGEKQNMGKGGPGLRKGNGCKPFN